MCSGAQNAEKRGTALVFGKDGAHALRSLRE